MQKKPQEPIHKTINSEDDFKPNTQTIIEMSSINRNHASKHQASS